MPLYKKDVEALIEVSNAEANEKLSSEIVAHLKDVQERIYEINFNQHDFHLRKKELEATLGGLYDWFQRLGFADIEIYYLMKDLDLEKQAFLN
jgi:outer membrane protein assembly factor BamA